MDKRTQLIETALELFYEKGINSVGINEILKVSGVAKKTLYNHFSSKEELVLATLEARDQEFMDWLKAELANTNSDTDVIQSLFESLTAWFNNETSALRTFRGCFFINTAIENGDLNQKITDSCKRHKQQVFRLIQKKLTSKNDDLANAICLLKEGAIVSAYVSKNTNAAMECIPLAKCLLKK